MVSLVRVMVDQVIFGAVRCARDGGALRSLVMVRERPLVMVGLGGGFVGISPEIVILLVAQRVMREVAQQISEIDIFKYANCILSSRP